MHQIVHVGVPPQVRLVAAQSLSTADFDRVAQQLRSHGSMPIQARKVGYVAARQVAAPELVDTRFNSEAWTTEAHPGDWVVTNMRNDRQVLLDAERQPNTYVIRNDKFAQLYERDTGDSPFGAVYRPRGVVDALLLPGGFDVKAPWGEHQMAPAGYLLRNGAEVYGIDRALFDDTYSRL